MASTIKETFIRCSNYEEAHDEINNYENINLIERLVEDIKNNPPWRIADTSLLIEHRQLELLSALMYIIYENKYTDIKVSDVGGGNGYLSFFIKKQLNRTNWEWTIFESNKMALHYSQFEDEAGIKWKSSNSQITKDSEVAIFSCSLQYLELPFKVLKKFALRHKYIIIMRLPFINEESHVITRQNFPDGGDYQEVGTSWPAWFFSREKFYSEINEIGNIAYQWETPSEVLKFEGNHIMLEGMLLHVK